MLNFKKIYLKSYIKLYNYKQKKNWCAMAPLVSTKVRQWSL